MKDHPVAGWTFNLWRDKFVIAITLLLALAILGAAIWPGILSYTLLSLLLAVWLLVLYFFRNPDRAVLDERGLVVGPGDGKVVEITPMHEASYLNADTTRISIFLSILDVHVQRAPLGGKIALVEHKAGSFLRAYEPAASDVNERISMVIESPYGRILLQQIAGILARRCVNFAQPGEQLRIGQRFGLIKFGSRVDLYLPPTAQILVAIGDQVYGGLTPIARIESTTIQPEE
jgi:phosphatidylserine decarboxylase